MTDPQARATGQERPRRGILRWVLTIVGVAILMLGAGTASVTVLAPESAERIYGQGQRVVQRAQHTVQQAVQPSSLPRVTLGDLGDINDVHDCDGSFVEMEPYRGEDLLQPTFAAHNRCGGDVMLHWEVGQEVEVATSDGSVETYYVSDARDVPKFGTTTGDVLGMSGEALLQSCYYGDEGVRFIALTPVGQEPTTPDVTNHSGVQLEVEDEL